MNTALSIILTALSNSVVLSLFQKRQKGDVLRGIFISLTTVFPESKEAILKHLTKLGSTERKRISQVGVKKVKFTKTKDIHIYDEDGKCLTCGTQTHSKYANMKVDTKSDLPKNEVIEAAEELDEPNQDAIEDNNLDALELLDDNLDDDIKDIEAGIDDNVLDSPKIEEPEITLYDQVLSTRNVQEVLNIFMGDKDLMIEFAEDKDLRLTKNMKVETMANKIFDFSAKENQANN